ncbi:SRPBCC family protein [Mucilaginibacter sp. KACC 22063]|uniref:SRPBCC family protein n=1 Tax=Mucilaginibacter sp. KACC 22063 TaxID=3025666 RepID=UPI0023672D2C|nr:SRPBCC family protein [Mucilaginibacter sp. KACC 22063]WDF56474.1 SRPBCC family protein [Mucilaginibacter sp. KACC 22063]
MPLIALQTFINAPQQVCFDLSRSIDLHKISTAHTNEEAVAGVTSGLIGMNETVTWRAKHLGIWFQLTSKITQFDPFNAFTDEMVKGPFKYIHHQHIFEVRNGGTLMTDMFSFASPFGLLGLIADKVLLTSHLKKLLIQRNEIIKEYAESDRWKDVISYQ